MNALEKAFSRRPVFNIFQQITMRVVEKEREAEDGIQISYVPANACMTQRRDLNKEAEKLELKNVFADDTTILCRAERMDEARTITKKVMKLSEETTNEAKEENVTFGGSGAANTRFLGVYMGKKRTQEPGSKDEWVHGGKSKGD